MKSAIHVALIIAASAAVVPSPVAGQYVDTAASCLLCHQTALPQNDFCSVVPAAVWSQSDKHNRAFYLLHESDPTDPTKGQAKRDLVKNILGFDLREAFIDDRFQRLKADEDAETIRKVAEVKSCLRCHATWPTEADKANPHAPPVPLALGVSCQACHGPGEKWETPHRLAAWRCVTPAGKASLGCADVRSTVEKAKLCASCHIGDLAQEKFVRHEWYAAGHPPLPSFELAEFSEQMPVHWKSLREKGAFAFRDTRPPDDAGLLANQFAALARAGIPPEQIKANYREANFPAAAAAGQDPAGDLPRTKEAIVSGLVVLESYTRLVGEYSARAAENKSPWPELALYDCTACHHEPRSMLSLNQPPRKFPLGRPPLAEWPGALARLGIAQQASFEPNKVRADWQRLRAASDELQIATTVRPFGDPQAMREKAAILSTMIAEFSRNSAATPFDRTTAERSLTVLTTASYYDGNDYATARQAAWAIRAIARDLGAADAHELFQRDGKDVLALRLPSGPQASVIENLGIWLPAAARFDSAWFRDELTRSRTK